MSRYFLSFCYSLSSLQVIRNHKELTFLIMKWIKITCCWHSTNISLMLHNSRGYSCINKNTILFLTQCTFYIIMIIKIYVDFFQLIHPLQFKFHWESISISHSILFLSLLLKILKTFKIPIHIHVSIWTSFLQSLPIWSYLRIIYKQSKN